MTSPLDQETTGTCPTCGARELQGVCVSGCPPTCGGCGREVRSPAIKFCGEVKCQVAACNFYGVKYFPWSREEQARRDTEWRRRRREQQTDRKGYGEHAGRRQLNQER